MSNGSFRTLQRIAGISTLWAALTFGTAASAQNQRPGYPPGAQHSWHGKQEATPPQGMPAQGPAPAGAPPTALHPVPVSTTAPGKATPAGERFFIVASIDLQKSQLLLKYPTEVTLLAVVNNATKFSDESGKALKLSDLRAGDTVWMVSSGGQNGEVTAIRIHKGQMTVADLHRYYLDYAEIK